MWGCLTEIKLLLQYKEPVCHLQNAPHEPGALPSTFHVFSPFLLRRTVYP